MNDEMTLTICEICGHDKLGEICENPNCINAEK